MTRFVDIISHADGNNGPLGAPLKCVEHEDEARALLPGATRMTIEEYRAQQKTWDEEWAQWWAERPPEPPPPPPPETLPAWACKAALEEAGLLEAARRATQELGIAWKWRFAEATIWQRSDVLPFAPLLGLSEAEVDALLRRAATIAGL
jgi:hypothetical protein